MQTYDGWYVASVSAPLTTPYQGWTPCIEWCKKQFGNMADSGWLYDSEGVFKFRDEPDYAWFILRWT